jgi:hypothetical protein
MGNRDERKPRSLFSSHGLVLIAISRNPRATLEELAEGTELAPRYVSIVLSQLRSLGFVRRLRDSTLVVDGERRFIAPMLSDRTIDGLLHEVGGADQVTRDGGKPEGVP